MRATSEQEVGLLAARVFVHPTPRLWVKRVVQTLAVGHEDDSPGREHHDRQLDDPFANASVASGLLESGQLYPRR
jgi:hypothetical protein